MTNAKTAAKLAPAAMILLPLLLLLIPSVREGVAMVPEMAWNSITGAWGWITGTIATVWNWIF